MMMIGVWYDAHAAAHGWIMRNVPQLVALDTAPGSALVSRDLRAARHAFWQGSTAPVGVTWTEVVVPTIRATAYGASPEARGWLAHTVVAYLPEFDAVMMQLT